MAATTSAVVQAGSIAQANKDFWDSHSSRSMYQIEWIQQLTGQVRTFLSQNIAFLGLEAGTAPHVLDYACAHGTVSSALLSVQELPKLHATGLDIAPSMLAEYKSDMAAAGVPPTRFEAVEADLVLEDELDDSVAIAARPELAQYDLLVVGMALHHMRDHRLALRRLAKRVKIGGVVCVVDWDYPNKTPGPKTGDLYSAAGDNFANEHTHPHGHGHGQNHSHAHGHSHGHGHGHGHGHDGPGAHPAVTAGTIAHAGFSRAELEDAFSAAGCRDFDYRVYPDAIATPFGKPDDVFGGVWKVGFSRAVRKE